jgi:hypothetical protein
MFNEYERNREEGCGLDSCSSGQGPVAGFCEGGNIPSGSAEVWEFRASETVSSAKSTQLHVVK